MNTPDLFTPVRLGALEAPNRIVMAPLTRMRAGPGRVPTTLMANYYAQRAAAGRKDTPIIPRWDHNLLKDNEH